ncbi:MAG: Rid family detoxifying hydrolase [Buchnera aphidicola (Meitanaphis elongallis)]
MKVIINTSKMPNPIGPYTTAIKIDNLIFISGQISSSVDINDRNNDIVIQTKEILNNIKHILEQANSNVEDIIKTTLFITSLKYLDTINNIYKTFFLKYSNCFPTRSCVEVSKLPKNALIEIETIAYKKI